MKRFIMFMWLIIPSAVCAAGGGGDGNSGADSTPDLQEIKTMIDNRDYVRAISHLNTYLHHNSNSADAYNYLGFSYRKSGNLPAAFTAYEKALALDPKHLGAHEYLGEAYLQNREPDKARTILGRLKGLCGNCEEAKDLEKEIASYK